MALCHCCCFFFLLLLLFEKERELSRVAEGIGGKLIKWDLKLFFSHYLRIRACALTYTYTYIFIQSELTLFTAILQDYTW